MMRLAAHILTIAMAALWILPHAVAGSAAVPQLLPVDEANRRSDFVAFRQELQQIVAQRDVSALLQILDPDIKNSFGGDGGIEEFKQLWEPDSPQTKLWDELGSVLSLGGTFTEPETFVAPYVFSRWPKELDGYEYLALVDSNVVLRSAPDEQATVIETLSFAVLRLIGDLYPGRPWAAVLLPDGRQGFVAADLVRSPIDYRAFFKRTGGRWRMTVFIAGD